MGKASQARKGSGAEWKKVRERKPYGSVTI
jgi:hypothetical protein